MKNQLTPTPETARKFIKLLAPDGITTFQTFDDVKGSKNKSLARVFHGSLDQHLDDLITLQQAGAGVYMMVNQGDGIVHPGQKSCRTTESVVAVRAIFADLDGAPLDPVLQALKPDIVVESSPERYHTYWLTKDCPLDQFKTYQRKIAVKFSSDPSVCDLPRVMRLPGFFHQKNTPFLTRIIFLA